ncbi:restriction endonuclease subunit S [Komagataeibacter sp. FNDCR1]|nr:hypothetical protein [Komagataeibacter sp. FXV2]MCE2578460.1 restriction endonuclease subunit S [Komagataeibacter sp. FNDCR1]
MSFPKYPAYKDSGVKWIGEIPTKWRLVPLKSAARFVGGGTPSKDNLQYWNGSIPWVSPKDMKSDVIVDTEDHITDKAISETATQIVPSGNVLLVVRSGILRHTIPVAINAMEVALNQDMKCIIINHKIYDVHYIFRLIQGANSALLPLWSKQGATVESLEFDYISNTVFPLPPLSEQQEIASFLDRECGKIDTLIAEQERLIALLAEKRQAVISHAVTKGLNPNAPMKDSGIPWIGMVPEGWNIVKIGKIFSEINEPGNDSLPILSVSIHSGVSDDELSEEKLDRKVTRSDDRSKYIVVRPGDLTYNMMRAWQGGFGAVQVLGMVSPAYVVARPKNIFWQKTVFIELLLRTPNAIVEMKRHSRGVTDFRLRLYWDEFKNISIPLPKWEEQNSILNFIKKKTGQFDALSMVANKAIVLLKERRSALISAAVTGKIDVRNQSKANAA